MKKRPIVSRGLLLALVAGVFLGSGVASQAQASAGSPTDPLSSGLLSQVGERAIDDLRRCLTNSDTLNVFYLIDNSGSLAQFIDPPRIGTDPDFKRVEVINQSLRSLAELTEGSFAKNVNFAMGFFDTTYSDAIGWSDLDRSTLPAIENEVDRQIRIVQPPGGFTDWEEGIIQSQRALQQQSTDAPGCQMLVWLTDGGINVRGNIALTEQSAVNLCGNDFENLGYQPAVTNGVFNALRQGGISVFAVFLNADPGLGELPWSRPLMRPLAEGTGVVEGKEVTCGIVPVPDNYAAGAFIEADSIQALGNQFLRLSAIIGGGSDGVTVGKDGIAVSPGVVRVQVIGIDPQAVLTTPTGRAITPASPDSTFIDASVDSLEEIGTWKISSQTWEPPAIVWGALRLDPAGISEVAAGAPQSVPFTLDTGGSSIAQVSDYVFSLVVTTTYPDGEQQTVTLSSSELSAGTNSFTFTPDARYGEVEIRYQTQGLRTAEGGITLSEVVAETRLSISPPTQFPTVSAPVITQALMGSVTPAQGQMTITGPVDGNNGEVCIPGLGEGSFASAPTIQDDSADRFANWQWTLTPAAQARVIGDCIQVAGGETTSLTFTASHPESADSVVRALASITLRDDQGVALDVTREIVFPSERIFFSSVANALRLILLALGIVLPFVLLYLVTLFTTKIDHGRDLRRASIPVTYRLSDNQILGPSGAPLKPQDVDSDAFKFRQPIDDARKITDPDLGELRAVVSANPLRPPWFEVVGKPNSVVFTGKSPGALLKKRFESGDRALFGGQMSKLWALTFPEKALLDATDKDAELRGTLVVYSRNTGAAGPTEAEVLTGVLNEAKISGALTDARQAKLAQAKTKKPEKSPKNKPPGPAGSSGAGSTLPPPPRSAGTFGGPARGGPPSSPPPSSSPPSSPPPPPPPPPPPRRP